MLIPILKYISQIIMLVSGVIGVWRTQSFVNQGTQKRRITTQGFLSIAGIIVGFLLFVATDLNERAKSSERNNSQRNEIAELRKSLNLSHDLEGIEISFAPSQEVWAEIESDYSKIPNPVKEIPYSAATMTARWSEDNWTIDLGEIKGPAGVVKYPPIKSNDQKYKAFVAIIDKACPSIWIDWGAKVQTEIEPRGRLYPSAISISQAKISITLRSPELIMKLKHVSEGLTVTVRSNSQPATLRFVSLDDEAVLDQTVNMQWREEEGASQNARDDYLNRSKPYISGPHKLQVTLKI